MNKIKVLDTQEIHIEQGSMFNTEDARQKYVQMNGDLCFYNNSSLTTDKSVVASAWYKILYNGIPLSFHFRSTFLLKLTHNLKSDLVQNRVMGFFNNEHVISIHSDEDIDAELPFQLDRLYHYNCGEIINEQILEIVDFVSRDFQNRLKIAVSYYFINLNFFGFKQCQEKIISKITEQRVDTIWDNFLACSVDHSASHYIHSCLYPERKYIF